MPRGVYDRSKNKGDSKTETAKTPKKTAAKPATASPVKAKKGGSVAVLPTADSGTQFAILRENISTLAHVRVELGNSDAARQVELELVQHITTLTKLRQDVFGKTEAEEKAAQSDTSPRIGNGTGPTIPLPANPVNIPPPPTA